MKMKQKMSMKIFTAIKTRIISVISANIQHDTNKKTIAKTKDVDEVLQLLSLLY